MFHYQQNFNVVKEGLSSTTFALFRPYDYGILSPGGETMSEEYTLLFNTITDVLDQLEHLSEKLKQAQQQAEEIYISR